MKSFVICTARQLFGLSNQKTIRWVGHLVLNGGRVHKGYWCGKVREKAHLEDLGVRGKVILKLSLKCVGNINCIDLAQERDKGRAVMNTVMNFVVS